MSDLAQFTLFFILFLFPSLFVFLYKFNAWSKVRKKGFWYFLYSEYISILIILGIIVTVVGTAILIQRYQAPKYSHSIEYYKRHQDYHTLEKIYKSKVIGNTPDWADVYNHIYYHFKQPYTFVDDENNFLGVRSDSSLARFYHRFLKAKLPEEKQIWYFYKTLQWSLVNRPELAISEFITHDLYDLPYLNYFIGTFEWERPLIAEDHFKKEIDNKGFVEEAYIALSKLYIENQRFDDLERLLNTPEASRYIPL
ncbi:MAG: hypothetical protein JXR60_11200, partial [Bacteroidales bacterium]|nr:hypothetical protein [Bacteroidales bacterium]